VAEQTRNDDTKIQKTRAQGRSLCSRDFFENGLLKMHFEFLQIPEDELGVAKVAFDAQLRGARVDSARKDFVANAEGSFWASCLDYLDGAAIEKVRPGAPGSGHKVVLSEVDPDLLCSRELRKALAENDSVIAYSRHETAQVSDRETHHLMTAATDFPFPTRLHRARERVVRPIWSAAMGLEAGEPGRREEQERDQGAPRRPQHRHTREYKRQRQFPPSPQIRLCAPEGAARTRGRLKRPSSYLSANEQITGVPYASCALGALPSENSGLPYETQGPEILSNALRS
jgi:hypothetical protein